MPQVRVLSPRPHENNPNILLLGEAFGLFVLFEYKALDKAAKTACEMFAWVKGKTKDKEVLADYKFFAEKTPHWAFSFSGLYSSEDNDFTRSERYKNAVKEIEKVLCDV